MKKHFLLCCILLACATIATTQVNNQSLIDQYNQNTKSSATVSFEENKGQVKDQHWQPRPDVLFSGESNGLVYHIRENGISYQLSRVESWKEEDDHFGLPKIDSMESRMMADEIGIYRIDVNWLNANQNCEVVKGKALHGYTNYYNVPDGVEPALNVLKYDDVTFKNVWNGVDLHYFSRDGALESDWLMERAEDYRQIRFEVKGAELSIDEEDYLIMNTPFGEIREGKLKVYQEGVQLRAEWKLDGNMVSFRVYNYDGDKPLRIDPPTRIWGTYYGGSDTEYGYGCATDSQNNIYLTGGAFSLNAIAITGAQQVTIGGIVDAFLVKFDSNGVRQWGTYYGGSDNDYGFDCATDNQNNIYISGMTMSTNAIATIGAHQVTFEGWEDAILVKFDSNGVRQWGTYYGGSNQDIGNGCAIDSQNNIYIVGYTASSNSIATTGAHQVIKGYNLDAFLVKFDSNGVRQWGTYYGGSSLDAGAGCAIDNQNSIYIVGATQSSNAIATTGAHQVTKGWNTDAFLVKFDSNGVRQWGTYYGGSDDDHGYDCATDNQNNIYIIGRSSSTNAIATTGAHQVTYVLNGDAFLIKFNFNGVRQWGTYYGGSGIEYGFGCATDSQNNIYITGWSNSTNAIATTGAHQETYGGGGVDVFLVKFDSNGVRQWGTYYGGSSTDYGNGCAIDSQNNIYITGEAFGPNVIATTGAHQVTNGGGSDAFLVKFYECMSNLQAMVAAPIGNSFCLGDSLILTANSGTGFIYHWLSNGQIISGSNNSIFYAIQPGSYSVRIIDSTGCFSLSNTLVVTANPPPSAAITAGGSLAFCLGNEVTLNANTGAGLTYQWKQNGTPITSATTSSLIANQNGAYTVLVSDSLNCSKESTPTNVTVHQPPTAVLTPNGATTFCYGDAVTLNASTGTGLSYQWFMNNMPFPNTQSSYIVTQPAGYHVVMTNSFGCKDTSSIIQVIVNPLPTAVVSVADDHFCQGDTMWYSANVGLGLSYQWYRNGTALPADTTSLFGALLQGQYHVVVTDMNSCQKSSDTFNLLYYIPYEGEEICAVTLDSATGKNMIVWEKAINQRIMQYNIYREGAATGQYNLIGSMPYFALSTFVDNAANPLQQSYRYKLSILDACGNESSLSPMHRTIHLASNMGASGEINLQWTAYEGATYQTHKVLRSNAGSPFMQIGQVAGNMYSFTDLTPPIGQNRYFVEIEVDGGCSPTIGKGGSYSTVQSNRVAMNVIGVPSIQTENHFKIFPNPAKDEVTIKSSINLSDASYELLDILGRKVLAGAIESDETRINIGNLSTGVYLLTVSSEARQIKETVKLVVE